MKAESDNLPVGTFTGFTQNTESFMGISSHLVNINFIVPLKQKYYDQKVKALKTLG